VAYIGLPPAAPHIKEGAVRALAVTSPKRSPIVPDVPTMAESGLDDQETELIIGLVAPAGTPKAVVDVLSRQLARIVLLPDIQQRLTEQGLEPVATSGDQFAAVIRSDIIKLSRVIKQAGIRID
jgi:tripartite-type tricarboxylate transporter receptor subunit TctC